MPNGFATTPATGIVSGRSIVERDEKGRVTRRVKVTEVTHFAHRNHVHVTTQGGTVWCYDANALVEID
jgi:hypothetical protein